jgi:S-adenosylmethionine-dependent methyltransferase
MKGPNERYHDRVAPIYDDIYDGSDYWRFYRDLTWHSLRPRLPRTAGARVADLGCGTGEWGLRCAASGYRVTFVDLSSAMLRRARERFAADFPGREAAFVRADIADLTELETGAFALAVAQGDPLSFTADPVKAVREIARILEPGGAAVASVDNRWASYDHYLERGDLQALDAYHKSGSAEWLARDRQERFATRAFFPAELRKLFERAGLEVVEVAGKTLLGVRRHPKLLEDQAAYRRLLAIELECRREPGFLGRAAHLEIVARKPT